MDQSLQHDCSAHTDPRTAAFERVHRAAALGAIRVARQPADADDYAQEAFLRLWKAIPQCLEQGGITPALAMTIGRRAAVKAKVRTWRRATVEGGSESLVDVPERGVTDPVQRVDAKAAVEALTRLPERERVALRMRFGLDGPPAGLAEIGRSLGVCTQRAHVVVNAGVERLRAEMGVRPE
jgi:RNA polymerase sigma factor (sigma-70 family)